MTAAEMAVERNQAELEVLPELEVVEPQVADQAGQLDWLAVLALPEAAWCLAG